MNMLPRFLLRCSLLIMLGLLSGMPAMAQHEPQRILRVCVPDVAIPPFINNDPKHLGWAERIMVDAGREVGLGVLVLRYPVPRCRAMLDNGDSMDAIVSAPTPSNLANFRFPTKAGALDPSKRIAKLNLVWIRRPESDFAWNGRTLSGGKPAELLVGSRVSVHAAIDPLKAMGFRVDTSARSVHQLLLMLAGRRIDLAVALQEEAELALQDQQLHALVVLPQAFASMDFYAAVRPGLPADLNEKIEAWWNTIGRLRDRPEYRTIN